MIYPESPLNVPTHKGRQIPPTDPNSEGHNRPPDEPIPVAVQLRWAQERVRYIEGVMARMPDQFEAIAPRLAEVKALVVKYEAELAKQGQPVP